MNPFAPKLNARRLRRQDGMALVLVLLVIAVLSLLGIAGTRSAQTELQMGGKELVGRQALSVAEAGINHAYSLVSADATLSYPPSALGFAGELSNGGTGGALASLGTTATLSGKSYRFRSFGGGTADGYYVQAVDNYDETSGANDPATDRDGKIYLVSRGHVGSAERIVTALVAGNPIFPNAVFGNRSVKVGGGALVDGFDSRNGAYSAATAGSTSVRSDGDVNVGGTNTLVKGDATASGTVSVGGGATVTGAQNPGAPTASFPPVPVCGPPYSPSTGISGTNYTYDPSTGVLTTDSHNTGSVTLLGGTYCFQSITLQSHATLQISSPVNIYLTGLLEASSGTFVNTTAVANNLKLFSSFVSTYKSNGDPSNNQAITLSGGQQSYMAVYAPQAAVTFSGNSDFYGSVIADYVADTGGTPIHYDGALGTVLGAGAGLSKWHEVRN